MDQNQFSRTFCHMKRPYFSNEVRTNLTNALRNALSFKFPIVSNNCIYKTNFSILLCEQTYIPWYIDTGLFIYLFIDYVITILKPLCTWLNPRIYILKQHVINLFVWYSVHKKVLIKVWKRELFVWLILCRD